MDEYAGGPTDSARRDEGEIVTPEPPSAPEPIVEEIAALLYGVAVVAKPLPLDWPHISEEIKEPWRQQVRRAFEYGLLPATTAALRAAYAAERSRPAASHGSDLSALVAQLQAAARLLREAPVVQPVNYYPMDWYAQRLALLHQIEKPESEAT